MHGRLFVGDSFTGFEEYRWGGTSCGSKTVSAPQLAELQAGMNNPRIMIDPVSLLAVRVSDGDQSEEAVLDDLLYPSDFVVVPEPGTAIC
jgi:hypothetical protein